VSKFQKTINSKISFSGIGLHSGEKVNLELFPAKENYGICFFLKNSNKKIEAKWSNIKIANLCTQIKKDKIIFSTIEHLMSALSAFEITNLKIISSSSEIPILDGSSKEYVEKINEVGIKNQKRFSKVLKITKKVEVKKGHKYISIEPNNSKFLEIEYEIDYKDQLIKNQKLKYKHIYENYLKIFNCRTFCLHDELEKIFSMGLAKGGSLDNAIVVSGTKILNQGGLHYKDEFVRHKILDCVGDIYLSGYKIYGKIKSFQGGHEMNALLLMKIFENKNCFKIFDCQDLAT
jgi:UDP-3-O-[3-hydroxymyristoyl] N-acetylglucosamine deacetylase